MSKLHGYQPLRLYVVRQPPPRALPGSRVLPGRKYLTWPTRHGFASSPSQASYEPEPSGSQALMGYLRSNNIKKWGWNIYRCTYDDDRAWSSFKSIIDYRLRESVIGDDVPGTLQCMEWTLVEQPSLDGMRPAQLRERFRSWSSELSRIVQSASGSTQSSSADDNPRYRFFVHVDDLVLRSVVHEAPRPPDQDEDCFGSVNLVDARWQPGKEDDPYPDELRIRDEANLIDGCSDEDVGWMRISANMLDPSSTA